MDLIKKLLIQKKKGLKELVIREEKIKEEQMRKKMELQQTQKKKALKLEKKLEETDQFYGNPKKKLKTEVNKNQNKQLNQEELAKLIQKKRQIKQNIINGNIQYTSIFKLVVQYFEALEELNDKEFLEFFAKIQNMQQRFSKMKQMIQDPQINQDPKTGRKKWKYYQNIIIQKKSIFQKSLHIYIWCRNIMIHWKNYIYVYFPLQKMNGQEKIYSSQALQALQTYNKCQNNLKNLFQHLKKKVFSHHRTSNNQLSTLSFTFLIIALCDNTLMQTIITSNYQQEMLLGQWVQQWLESIKELGE